MSMPVSIGDILLLSKIAYNIGVAFTSGRKSAPREFAEVENQLFALSTALEVLTQHATKTNDGPTTSSALVPQSPGKTSDNSTRVNPLSSLQSMIVHCRQTLEGLEKVVEKYSKAMDPQPISKPQTMSKILGVSLPKRKWKKTLKNNWSRVVWTTEGDNLATLRDHLVLHISTIHLVVSAMQSSKIDLMEEQLQRISKILENPIPTTQNLRISNNIVYIGDMCLEIPPAVQKTGFEENQIARRFTDMRVSTPPETNPGDLVRAQTLPASIVDKSSLYTNKPVFQVYFESSEGELQAVCPKACIYRGWVPGAKGAMSVKGVVNKAKVFTCRCKGSSINVTSDLSTGNELDVHGGGHEQELDDIYFFPMTFATRMTGDERKWCIFPTGRQSSGTLSKLVIKGVRPTDLDKFERKFVDRLNLNAASDMMERQATSTFVYIITDDSRNYRVALLELMGDDSQFKDCLKSVTFDDASGSRRTESIDYIQILDYKTIPLADLKHDMKSQRDQFQYSKTAELAIYLLQTDEIEDQQSIHIHFNADTDVQAIPNSPKRLLIKDIGGFTSEGRDMSGDIIIRTSSVAALQNLQEMIEEMKAELYVQILKGPSWNEQTIFQLYAGDIRITDKLITDAEILITRDPSAEPERHRLLIRSLNGSAYFCKEIPGPTDFPPVLSRLLIGYTVFVEITDLRRIIVFPEGLAGEGGLHFVNSRFDYVFKTELESLAGRFSNQDLTTSAHLLEYP